MEFFVKKTTELTGNEQEGILSLFNEVFNRDRSLKHFRSLFVNNPLGFSYHSMVITAGQIVGSYSCIPFYYHINGKRYLSAVAVDNMISQQYRGFTNFYHMVTNMHKCLIANGFSFSFTFPNENAYPVFIKSKLMKDIGNLAVYCLPYRIGGIKRQLKMFNWFSILFVKCYAFFTSLISGNKIYQFAITKEATSHNATRYKRFDGDYHIIDRDGGFVYKLMEYEGIRSVFLIDVFEKSATNFNRAVRYIIKKHQKEFDILLYVGNLPFRFHGLVRLPQKLSPKRFHFTGAVLDDTGIDKDLFFNIDNWDVNLSNYDLV
jgi:hypothetical protein